MASFPAIEHMLQRLWPWPKQGEFTYLEWQWRSGSRESMSIDLESFTSESKSGWDKHGRQIESDDELLTCSDFRRTVSYE